MDTIFVHRAQPDEQKIVRTSTAQPTQQACIFPSSSVFLPFSSSSSVLFIPNITLLLQESHNYHQPKRSKTQRYMPFKKHFYSHHLSMWTPLFVHRAQPEGQKQAVQQPQPCKDGRKIFRPYLPLLPSSSVFFRLLPSSFRCKNSPSFLCLLPFPFRLLSVFFRCKKTTLSFYPSAAMIFAVISTVPSGVLSLSRISRVRQPFNNA